MAMYRVKRFSISEDRFFNDDYYEDGRKSNSSGSNWVMPTLAGAGLAAGGFYGARKGMFGESLQKTANNAWDSVKNAFSGREEGGETAPAVDANNGGQGASTTNNQGAPAADSGSQGSPANANTNTNNGSQGGQAVDANNGGQGGSANTDKGGPATNNGGQGKGKKGGNKQPVSSPPGGGTAPQGGPKNGNGKGGSVLSGIFGGIKRTASRVGSGIRSGYNYVAGGVRNIFNGNQNMSLPIENKPITTVPVDPKKQIVMSSAPAKGIEAPTTLSVTPEMIHEARPKGQAVDPQGGGSIMSKKDNPSAGKISDKQRNGQFNRQRGKGHRPKFKKKGFRYRRTTHSDFGIVSYRIPRFSQKLFADSEKKDSGSTLGKIVTGTALAAGTFYGARKGMLGNTLRRGSNTLYGQVGKMVGSESMVNSAAANYAKGAVKNPGAFTRMTNSSARDAYQNDLAKSATEFKTNLMTPKQPANPAPAPASGGGTPPAAGGGSTTTSTTSTKPVSDQSTSPAVGGQYGF